ncbi:hypothetical protein [Mycolicibacterium conceptionense]|nr:hypothetical protein [Mycolicibacterium conceptionense]
MKAAKFGQLQSEDILLYTDPTTGKRGVERTDRRATWSEVAKQFKVRA